MQSFLNSVQAVTIILLLTATGYVCAAKGWMGPQTKAFLGKFVIVIAIPCMCVYGLTENLSREMIAESGKMLFVPAVCTALNFLLSYLLAKALHLPRKSFGVFIMMCSLSNSIFVGYAMCRELFGEACTPFVMLYYLISTSFTQVLGMSLIRWSGEAEAVSPKKAILNFITTPTVIAVVVGFILVLGDVKLPALIHSYFGYMNSVVSPLALLLTGYIIYDIGLKNLRFDRQQILVMAFRFLISPALFLLLCRIVGITGLARDVFVVEAAMPVVTQTVVAAAEYGADERLAAQGAALTALASFVVVPVLMLVL